MDAGTGRSPTSPARDGERLSSLVWLNRVDLLTMIDGVTFDEAWHDRVSGHYGREVLDSIGRAERIRHLRASGRPQDLLDIEGLS